MVLIYDIKKNNWIQPQGHLNFKRQNHSSCVLCDFVYIFDGTFGTENFERYDAKAQCIDKRKNVEWELIYFKSPKFMYWNNGILVVPINSKEILILASEDEERKK